jgi:sortase A
MINRKSAFLFLSNLLILGGVAILLLIFGSPVFQEVRYQVSRLRRVEYRVLESKEEPIEKSKAILIVPESRDFGIVIPKINANARIFANIDPFNELEFLPVLKKGVAHAKETSFPGHGKNIYLFAHSTDAFYNVGRYNAVFYLIGKLKEGDEIDIYYKDRLFKYFVFEKKVVDPRATKYLEPGNEEILTLQTCYPPGTTLKRLVVRAKVSQ